MKGRLPQLRDSWHVWHWVAPERCRCGCVVLRALDDPSLTWDPGDWEAEDAHTRCTDRSCRCHMAPARGDTADAVTIQLEGRVAGSGAVISLGEQSATHPARRGTARRTP